MNNLDINKKVALALKQNITAYKLTILSGKFSMQFAAIIDNNLYCSEDSKNIFSDIMKNIDLNKAPFYTTFNDDINIFVEKLAHKPELIICGAGHVSLYVAKLASMMDFDVTVIDDRVLFANKERFPEAKNILCCDFKEALQNVNYGSNCYFVIVTRGHLKDKECLEEILHHNYAYVGMIGSHRKIGIVMDYLKSQDVSQDKLDSVHAPIGLNIGAHTPNEIALCIVAQVVDEKNKLSIGDYVGDKVINSIINNDTYVEATVIDSSGSTPRGKGAKLLVLPDKSFVGTVGGGEAEMSAITECRKLIGTNDAKIIEFNMNNANAANQGMVCGGKIKVLINPITK